MKIKISGSGLLYFLSLKALSCRVSPCGNLLQISYELEKKWLRYRLYRVSGGVVVVVVGSDALLSSSPSLIWLQLGFGLARAVTIGFPLYTIFNLPSEIFNSFPILGSNFSLI